MEARRLQGWAFLLSTAALGMPGCDPEDEPDDEDPSTSSGSTSEGGSSSSADGSGEETTAQGDSTSGEATVCGRMGARYVDCYPGYKTVAEAIDWCQEHTAYLRDVSQECADTYVELADCLSQLECSEFQTGCTEELTAHGSLLCLGHE